MKKLLTALVMAVILTSCSARVDYNDIRWALETCRPHDGVDYYNTPGGEFAYVICNDGEKQYRKSR